MWSDGATDGHKKKKKKKLKDCKNKWSLIRCDGLLYDLLWRASLCASKINNFGCHGYLFKWESMQCLVSRIRRLLITLSLFMFKTTWSCLTFLFANVSQINWLPCQISGISNQALDFVRNVQFRITDENFPKRFIFYKNLTKNGLAQELLHLKNLWKTKFLITFDDFHGRERKLSIIFRIKYLQVSWTDKLLTLYWSQW